MTITEYKMWNCAPGTVNYEPYIMHYAPDEKNTDGAVLIIPGSGYWANPANPAQEGDAVAKHLCQRGINVFIVIYRVAPDS